MTGVLAVLTVLWLAVFLFWAISAATAKRAVHRQSEAWARIGNVMAWAAWWLLLVPNLHRGPLAWRFVPPGSAVAGFASGLGAGLTVLGLSFAVWARLHLGRNWSPNITLQEDHRLIRSGPYAIVRHPIYSGLMLATFGTALVSGDAAGLVSTALIVIGWGYKARREEALMMAQFGAQYERYRSEVKGLIPGVW
jgi:protein-S-isoprenylcysteine O-methyltransferase Ste14